MKYIILHVVFSTILLTNAASDAKIYADRSPKSEDQLDEPHVGRNLFENKGLLCFYTYCWRKRASCGGGINCCWCECKNSGAFFSQDEGCYSGEDIRPFLADRGDKCQFYTEKLQFSTVPLFSDAKNVNNIKIGLTSDEKSFKLLPNTSCRAGTISYYDSNGNRKRLYNNKCGEKFYMYPDETGTWNLRWKSTIPKDWSNMAGLLLKMDIHCMTGPVKFSSCILFQVSGKSTVDLDLPVPDEIPGNYTCPTVLPPVVKSTIAPTVKILNATDATMKGGTGGEGGVSGNIMSIIAGVLTAAVLLIAFIILIIFLRNRRKKKNTNETSLTLIPSPGRPNVQRNRYEDQRMIYEKPTDCGKEPKYYDDKACLYVAVDEEPPRYSSIEDENGYEPPDSRMSTLRRGYDMSKRPLPKTPTEVNNPYYAAHSFDEQQQQTNIEDRDADNSALYSIYSSIDNLRKT